jgi:protein associated with RNAse G/E
MKKMEYPKELDRILKNELNALIKIQKEKKGPFNTDEIANYVDKYKEILKSC